MMQRISHRTAGGVLLSIAVLLVTAEAQARAIQITKNEPGNCYSPKWAPDGSVISYERIFSVKRRIHLMLLNVKDRTEKRISIDDQVGGVLASFAGDAGQVCKDFEWSPPSLNRYIYACNSEGQNFDLFIKGVGQVTKHTASEGQPEWSPNGKWIVFISGRSGKGDLYLLDVFNLEKGPIRLTTSPEATELFPAFSPDSKKLVFVLCTDKGDDLYMIDNFGASAKAARRLTKFKASILRPAFSPDGNWIAFYSNYYYKKAGRNKMQFDIILYNLNTGKTSRLVRNVVVNSRSGPTWTPDSKWIVFPYSSKEKFDPLAMINIESRKLKFLPVGTQMNADTDVVRKPDGSIWLAFTAQGLKTDKDKTWRKLYIFELTKYVK